MKKILCVFGTRPEAIKMAPLVKELQSRKEVETVVCVTGQHREMLDQVLNLFQIRPDVDLNIMTPGQDLYDVTSRILLGMREIFADIKPDIVLVHGDTTTSFATSLSAYYQHIAVGHIEAGLRTYDIYNPFPEEINRQLTGRIAKYHFAPTSRSRENLLREGVGEASIIVTGNTVIDALYLVSNKIHEDQSRIKDIVDDLHQKGIPKENINDWMKGRKMVLVTGHRRENFGEGFIHICKALQNLALKYPEVDFVYPMHLNPNVRQPIKQIFGENSRVSFNNMFFIEPLEYLPFVFMMNYSNIVLTDSGGIQEEAPSFGKPVLVMRHTTERPEAVEAGTVKLVGTSYESLVNSVSCLLDSKDEYNKMARAINPYGDGLACKRIADFLVVENDR